MASFAMEQREMSRARARQLRLPRAMHQVTVNLVDSTAAQLAWPAGSIRAFRRVYAAKCTAASMRPLPVVARQLLRDETTSGSSPGGAFSLTVANTSFTDREFQPIAFGMAFDSAILHVALQHVALEDAQIASLATAVHVGLRGMVSLTVQSCRLCDVGGAKLLGALARRPAAAAVVSDLDLRANGMRADAASAMADLLDAQPIKSLTLDNNPFGDVPSVRIIEALGRSSVVQVVNMRSCGIARKGVQALCAHLQDHPSLETIDIDHNLISDAQLARLREALLPSLPHRAVAGATPKRTSHSAASEGHPSPDAPPEPLLPPAARQSPDTRHPPPPNTSPATEAGGVRADPNRGIDTCSLGDEDAERSTEGSSGADDGSGDDGPAAPSEDVGGDGEVDSGDVAPQRHGVEANGGENTKVGPTDSVPVVDTPARLVEAVRAFEETGALRTALAPDVDTDVLLDALEGLARAVSQMGDGEGTAADEALVTARVFESALLSRSEPTPLMDAAQCVRASDGMLARADEFSKRRHKAREEVRAALQEPSPHLERLKDILDDMCSTVNWDQTREQAGPRKAVSPDASTKGAPQGRSSPAVPPQRKGTPCDDVDLAAGEEGRVKGSPPALTQEPAVPGTPPRQNGSGHSLPPRGSFSSTSTA